MSKPKCYIAGPMRGLPEYNYPAFIIADFKLGLIGWETYNPAKMDLDDNKGHERQTIEEQEAHDTPLHARHFATRDLEVILKLRAEDGDALIMLPGWAGSIGARAERAVAQWIHLPVLTLKEALDAAN